MADKPSPAWVKGIAALKAVAELLEEKKTACAKEMKSGEGESAFLAAGTGRACMSDQQNLARIIKRAEKGEYNV